jgi:hypothetical protein
LRAGEIGESTHIQSHKRTLAARPRRGARMDP